MANLGGDGDGIFIFGRVQFPFVVCAHILGQFHKLLRNVIFILDLLHNLPLLDLDHEGFEFFDGTSLESAEEVGQEAARGVVFHAASLTDLLVEG